jgi:hypothetical protein
MRQDNQLASLHLHTMPPDHPRLLFRPGAFPNAAHPTDEILYTSASYRTSPGRKTLRQLTPQTGNHEVGGFLGLPEEGLFGGSF